MVGARPGRRLEVDMPAISSLETTIRRSTQALSLAITRACGDHRHRVHPRPERRLDWVPALFGSIGLVLLFLMLVDLFWKRGSARSS